MFRASFAPNTAGILYSINADSSVSLKILKNISASVCVLYKKRAKRASCNWTLVCMFTKTIEFGLFVNSQLASCEIFIRLPWSAYCPLNHFLIQLYHNIIPTCRWDFLNHRQETYSIRVTVCLDMLYLRYNIYLSTFIMLIMFVHL